MTTAPTESTKPDELLVRLLDPAVRADPYPLFAQFRDRGSFALPEGNLAVFSTYRDCDEVLRHPSSSNDRLKSTAARAQIEAQTRQLIEAGAEAPPQPRRDSCSRTRRTTPGCASWSARRSRRRW